MELTPLILGLGITAFLLLYFVFNLQKNNKEANAFHIALRLLTFFFFFILIVLIAKATLDNSADCELVLNETKDVYIYGHNYTGYHWDYEDPPQPQPDEHLFHKNTTYYYTYYCADDTTNTSELFYRTVTWLWRVYLFLISLYLIYELFTFMGRTIRK